MSDLTKKIIFITYYFLLIAISINNFNNKDFQVIYEFFNDKDKAMHFIQYFILVLLAFFTFKIKVSIKSFGLLCLFIVLSSGLSEFIQLYLPGRNSSYTDFFYDISGGIFAFIVFSGVNRLCCKK